MQDINPNIEEAKGESIQEKGDAIGGNKKPRYKFSPQPKSGYAQSGLDEKIDSARKSEGYLITITTIEDDDELKPTYFIRKFLRDDINPSLEEHFKMVEKEMPKVIEATSG